MIDFNDIPTALEQGREVEREAIRAGLLGKLEAVLGALFPAGKKRRDKFHIGDALGGTCSARNASTTWYQTFACCGWRIQWFSSG